MAWDRIKKLWGSATPSPAPQGLSRVWRRGGWAAPGTPAALQGGQWLLPGCGGLWAPLPFAEQGLEQGRGAAAIPARARVPKAQLCSHWGTGAVLRLWIGTYSCAFQPERQTLRSLHLWSRRHFIHRVRHRPIPLAQAGWFTHWNLKTKEKPLQDCDQRHPVFPVNI